MRSIRLMSSRAVVGAGRRCATVPSMSISTSPKPRGRSSLAERAARRRVGVGQHDHVAVDELGPGRCSSMLHLLDEARVARRVSAKTTSGRAIQSRSASVGCAPLRLGLGTAAARRGLRRGAAQRRGRRCGGGRCGSHGSSLCRRKYNRRMRRGCEARSARGRGGRRWRTSCWTTGEALAAARAEGRRAGGEPRPGRRRRASRSSRSTPRRDLEGLGHLGSLPGLAPYHPRAAGDDVCRAALDDPAVCGLLDRRGEQRLLPQGAGGGAAGGERRLRPRDPPRLRQRPSAGGRRRRQGRGGDRHRSRT